MSHQTDNSTSLAALEAMLPRLSSIQRRILDHLEARGLHGSTDAEMEHLLCINPKMNTRTRRNELVEMGLVVPTGVKRKSMVLGRHIGRTANVWGHARYLGFFPAAAGMEAKCERRLAFAKAAEELSLELKRLARELRTTNDSSSDIMARIGYNVLKYKLERCEYEYLMKEVHPPRARE